MELVTILLIVAGAILLFASYYTHANVAVEGAKRGVLVALQALAAMLLLLAGFMNAGML